MFDQTLEELSCRNSTINKIEAVLRFDQTLEELSCRNMWLPLMKLN